MEPRIKSSLSCRVLQDSNGGNVKLHYIDKGHRTPGSGTPVVFVHGGLQDYRQWLPQLDRFAKDYRVILYSRRYNYPNVNRPIIPDHSALVDAHDLADLLHGLDIPRDRIRTLPIPLLLFTGERTLPIHRAVNDEFEKLIPPGRRVTFKGCGHNMWTERRAACEDLTLQFLAHLT